jgi:PKD repeat protein
LNIETATGCTWDSTIVLPLNPVQEASFKANPDSGFTPLDVLFNNTSTQATDYQWLIDGEPISTNENLNFTFADTGSFEVALVAYRIQETCTDTAFFTLNVKQGIQILLPNIISPNADGRNDELVATIFGVESIQWTIFNRWGDEIQNGSAENLETEILLWNPDDTTTEGAYFIAIVVTGEEGMREEVTATVTLVR